MKKVSFFSKIKAFFVILLITVCPFTFAQGIAFEYPTNPDPNTNDLYAVDFFDANNGLAVGEGGVMIKCNGSDWSLINTSTTDYLYDVAFVGPSDAWAVGNNGTVVHYTGSSSATVSNIGTTNYLDEIIAFSANDIYVSGNYGRIYHYNGSSWTSVYNTYATFAFGGIWGTSGSDLYFVGTDNTSPNDGIILHYNGSTFTEVKRINGPAVLNGIWSPDNENFYISGTCLYKYNKTSGSLTQEYNNGTVQGLFGFSNSDILAAGMTCGIVRYNGSTWENIHPNTGTRGICAPNDNKASVYCVGNSGFILKMDLTSGVEEIQSLQDFSVYPNPAADQVSVNLSFTTSTNVNVAVYDLVGQRVVNVFQGFVGNETLKFDGSSLSPGVYFIRVEADGGVTSKKLVIQ